MTKLIQKYAEKKANIPVLGMVLVKNGLATINNLDFSLTYPAPANLGNGIYSPNGLYEGVARKENIDINEFPVPVKKELVEIHTYKNIEFLEALQFCKPAIDKADTHRFYLWGVWLAANKAIATNGHILNEFTLSKTLTNTVCLPYYAVNILIDVLKEQKQDIELAVKSYSHNKKLWYSVVATCGKATIEFKTIDATMPYFQRVIPQKQDKETVLILSEIKAAEKKFKIIMKQDGNKLPKVLLANGELYYKDKDNSLGVISTKTDCYIYINIYYLLASCGGKMLYTDMDTPIVLTNGHKRSVIMPIRG